MTNDLNDDYIKIKKEEYAELKSKIEEQNIIIEHTKGFAFGLESKNIKYLKRINELKDDIKKMEDKIELYESSTSWKITKPLRIIMRFLK